MAFENGNNMFDYCGEIFKRYQKDNLVFYKALQLLAYFKTRNDYPYCTDELSEVLGKVLGYDLGWLSDFVWKYTVMFGKEMKWDAENAYTEGIKPELSKEETDILVENFKNDMESFFIATTPFFEELFIGETNSIRLKKIALKQTYGAEKTIRLIRKDGQTFDFSVNTKDIQSIIDVFSGIK